MEGGHPIGIPFYHIIGKAGFKTLASTSSAHICFTVPPGIFQFSVFDVLTSQGLADLRGAISPRAGQILEKIKDLHMRDTSICKATHPELISLTTSFSGF